MYKIFMKTLRIAIFCILFNSTVFAESSESVQYFDYQSAVNIVVYPREGDKSIWFPKPLETDHSRGPAILYRDILSALSIGSALTGNLPDPMYIIDIQSESSYKRLYLGDSWISDGLIVSNFDGVNPVLNHIEKRFTVGSPVAYGIGHAEKSFNIEGDELVDLPQSLDGSDEKESIATTLKETSNLVEGYYPFGQVHDNQFSQDNENDYVQSESNVMERKELSSSSASSDGHDRDVSVVLEKVVVKEAGNKDSSHEAMTAGKNNSGQDSRKVFSKEEREGGNGIWFLFSIFLTFSVAFYFYTRKR